MHNSNALALGQEQVRLFCLYIEQWFNGTATHRDDLYEAIIRTFHPAFHLINGDDQTINFSMLTQWLHQVYGQFPTRTVKIENFNGYASSHHVVVTYTEIQTTGDTQTTREASAVFLIEDNQALWYHLVEVWK
ncbi:hypothetical protein [Myroides sp. WP-1]|uniref:hypothetical protein n=1 Tax=Myroides sp. WP-1 TaxID=2759944 RepID=UPI0015FDF771|nr:hypothetical protein [Myroides sp. WP-1]MBB1137912.1 hypothetical protein [Myroides sp. WP-1]